MSHLNWKTILPASILLGGFMVCTTVSYGTPAYKKASGKDCVFCHSDLKAAKDLKTLTKAGAYYHEHKSMDGFKEEKK